MRLKTILHFHSGEDPRDYISYNFYQGVDYAASLGFEVLALTCHQKVIYSKEASNYAAAKNILLIPGIEINVEKKHVVILNCGEDAEKIKSFKDLAEYKKTRPEIFILAPHPYFYGRKTLKNQLEKHIDLFDAVELSWFYSKLFNRNRKGEIIAKKYGKPFIAASDTHFFDFMDENYAFIDAGQKTIAAIFEAIKNKNFENITSPRRFFKDMFWKHFKFVVRSCLFNLIRRKQSDL
jgi:predicted metal-dependent phosphoesterase TrpH